MLANSSNIDFKDIINVKLIKNLNEILKDYNSSKVNKNIVKGLINFEEKDGPEMLMMLRTFLEEHSSESTSDKKTPFKKDFSRMTSQDNFSGVIYQLEEHDLKTETKTEVADKMKSHQFVKEQSF